MSYVVALLSAMDADVLIAELARNRHAVFHQRDALAVGVTLRQLQWRVRRGVLVMPEPRVYRVVAAPATWRQRVLAACLTEDGLASHRTAAALWRLDGCREGVVEVVTDRWHRRPNRSFRLHETSALPPEDRTEVQGIPVTTIARALVDLPAVLPRQRVEQAIDTAGVDLLCVWECVERLEGRGRPWVTVTKRLVAVRLGIDGVGPNLFERHLFEVLVRHGLPLPTPQVEIRRSDGTLVARVDWCFTAAKVVLECDSYRHHGQWLRRKADLRRDRELAALGYRVLRFSWEDVSEHERQVARDVDAVLSAVSA
jgi:very-short-patch-repair endonuclease